jgi:hypothetical protein
MTAGRQVLLSKARQVTSSSKRRRLTSTEDIIESLEKVELPSQMASSLQSPVVRHLLSVTPDRDAAVRLTFWLEHCIGDGKG